PAIRSTCGSRRRSAPRPCPGRTLLLRASRASATVHSQSRARSRSLRAASAAMPQGACGSRIRSVSSISPCPASAAAAVRLRRDRRDVRARNLAPDDMGRAGFLGLPERVFLRLLDGGLLEALAEHGAAFDVLEERAVPDFRGVDGLDARPCARG